MGEAGPGAAGCLVSRPTIPPPELKPKHQAFVDEFMVDRNATWAAIRAGYSQKTAYQIGHELLHREDVGGEIQRRINAASARSQLTVERVQEEIARLAFADPRKFFDDAGNLKPIHELDDDAAATLASIENEELFEGAGKDRERIGTLKKVKTWDKGRALELAAKHLGMVRETPLLAIGQLMIVIQD